MSQTDQTALASPSRTFKERAAEGLAYAYGVYTDPLLRATKSDRDAAIEKLGTYGIFSAKTISLIVKDTVYRVRNATRSFGNAELNPDHIQFFLYLMAGKGSMEWLTYMVNNGTNVATIAYLLDHSRSTIYRMMEDHENSAIH